MNIYMSALEEQDKPNNKCWNSHICCIVLRPYKLEFINLTVFNYTESTSSKEYTIQK